MITAFAIQKINETISDNVILPDEIHICHPTTLVYDNIDRLEENLSVTGTSHRINGIAIQKGFIGLLPSRKRTYVPKTKRTCEQLGEFLTSLGVCPGCATKVLDFDGETKWAAFLATVPPDPPPASAIDPANWRDQGNGVGVVEKRPREVDSGSEDDKNQKVHVTEVQRDVPLNDNDSLDGT